MNDDILKLRVRVQTLETLVCMLARGILQHEYSKDLSRHGTEEACKQLANHGNFKAAILALPPECLL